MEYATSTRTALDQTRVMLWCVPRSSSTVLTKCLSFVPDSEVIFEPYCYCYYAAGILKGLGKEDITNYDNVGEMDWRKVVELIRDEDCRKNKVNTDMLRYPHIKIMLDNPGQKKNVLFLKDMAFCIDGHYEFLPEKTSNYKFSFLIRHPAKVFTSWRKAMFSVFKQMNAASNALPTEPTTFDNFDMINDVPAQYKEPSLFYKEVYDLWRFVKDNYTTNPVVIDSDDLMSNPAGMLSKYCDAVGIPYSADLLKWQRSSDITDKWINAFMPIRNYKVFQLYCHTAFESTHFLPPTTSLSTDSMTQDVKECVKATMPYYEEMFMTRILP